MSNIDDIFRDGLGDRKPEVPRDMWNKIMTNKAAVPEGEALDRLFANGLRDRLATVPTGMWARIVAARRPANHLMYAAVLLLLLLSIGGGLAYFGTEDLPAPRSVPQEPLSVQATQPGQAPQRSRNSRTTPVKRFGVADTAPVERFGVAAITPEERLGLTSTKLSVQTTIKPLTILPLPPLDVAATLPEPGPVSIQPANSFFSGRRTVSGELLFGAAYAHQSLNTGSEGSPLLREAREVSEFPEVSFQFTARVSYPLRGRLGLIGGLTYAEIRNQLEYERPTTSGPALVRSNNRIRLLEAPLLLSYQLPGNKLHLSVNAGPVVNLTTGVSGRFVDPGFSVPRDLKQDGDYRGNIGIGWTASLTTTYLVGKSGTTELLLEPFFKSYPGSFNRPGARLSEKYWVAGLQFGVRKTL